MSPPLIDGRIISVEAEPHGDSMLIKQFVIEKDGHKYLLHAVKSSLDFAYIGVEEMKNLPLTPEQRLRNISDIIGRIESRDSPVSLEELQDIQRIASGDES